MNIKDVVLNALVLGYLVFVVFMTRHTIKKDRHKKHENTQG